MTAGQSALEDQQSLPLTPLSTVNSPQAKRQDDRLFLLETALQLFKLVEQERVGRQEQSPDISDQLLLALHSVFQHSLLVQALELVELGQVTSYVCYGEDSCSGRETHQHPSHSSTRNESRQGRRQLFLVDGSNGNKYLSFGSCMYCSCPSFAYSVLARRETLMCKHLLASYLATSLQHCTEVAITDEEWIQLADGHGPHSHKLK